jgi:hypothetical protein
MTSTGTLPAPSKTHATCAWCDLQLPTIVGLLEHVEDTHVGASLALARRLA